MILPVDRSKVPGALELIPSQGLQTRQGVKGERPALPV